MRIEERLARRITQRLAAHIQYRAPGAFQHALGGGGVPLRSGRQARVAVGGALGEQAELQRTADIGQLQRAETLAQPSQQALLLRTGMAPTGHHGEALARFPAHLDRPRGFRPGLTPGAQAGTAVVAAPVGGHADHAEQHASRLHQRHVDGEFAAAGDELLGAIQRVHQPPAPPAGTLGERNRAAFLGEHRDLRRQRRQPLDQHSVGSQVGGGHRRIVGLVLYGQLVAPERQDG